MTTKRNKKRSFSLGNIFEVQLLYKNIVFLVFVTFIGIVYIANGHRAEKKVRKIQKLQGEIEKSKFQYWESMSNVMYESIQSQTEKRVEDLGLKPGDGSIKIIKQEPVKKEE